MLKRKTKIVATIGPATEKPEVVSSLIQAGVNVFRMNFSHGNHDEHFKRLKTIREESKKLRTPVAILQDLGGPKIRITKIDENNKFLSDGKEIILKEANNNEISNNECIYVNSLNPSKVLKTENSILLADGIIELVTKEVKEELVVAEVVKGGNLRSNVGIAFPDSNLNIPATTDKDLKDLKWGIKNEVDFIAVSFVQTANDIIRVKKELKESNADISVVAKIEMKVALDNLDEIFAVTDAVMVARGDLGVELPVEKVPLIQKKLIEKANHSGIPVIVATQMLHSMVNSPRPTRAEVGDVANAVLSGADAVMLSEETAIGNFPVDAVSYLEKISLEIEGSFSFDRYKHRLEGADESTVSDAVAYAACAAAIKVQAKAIIALTETGTSARLVAKYRPLQPLFGTSSNERSIRKMSLYWGVIPIHFSAPDTHQDEVKQAHKIVQETYNFPNNTLVVTTGGLSTRQPGTTSVLDIREIKCQ